MHGFFEYMTEKKKKQKKHKNENFMMPKDCQGFKMAREGTTSVCWTCERSAERVYLDCVMGYDKLHLGATTAKTTALTQLFSGESEKAGSVKNAAIINVKLRGAGTMFSLEK